MVRRDITTELLEAAGEYPVVKVFGPFWGHKSVLNS